jgi:hypothetical protein
VDASGSRPVVTCVADIASGMPLVPTIPASNMDGTQALATLEPTYIREVAAKSLVERGIVPPKAV